MTAEYADVAFNSEIYNAYNVGTGGLAFSSDRKFDHGDILHLRITHLTPPFETDARVVWCQSRGNSVETGVEFLTSHDAYQARMIEQICHIEAYRTEVAHTEHRMLTANEAAAEWITRFAAAFPNPNDD